MDRDNLVRLVVSDIFQAAGLTVEKVEGFDQIQRDRPVETIDLDAHPLLKTSSVMKDTWPADLPRLGQLKGKRTEFNTCAVIEKHVETYIGALETTRNLGLPEAMQERMLSTVFHSLGNQFESLAPIINSISGASPVTPEQIGDIVLSHYKYS